MVRHAHERGIYTITSTNGHFLDMDNARRTVASGLDRIIISIDGATQAVYEQYRKEGTLETVLQGARNLVQARKEAGAAHPHIIFQMLVVRPNEHQIEDVRRIAREIGVDEVKLKTAQVYDFENGNALIPTIEKYSRYAQDSTGKWTIKYKLLNHCWKLWHACVITWDGLVVPCCFDKDATHRLGNLRETSFASIWQGTAYRQFRTQLLTGRDKIDICTNCTEGCSPWR
jgi:radical SAM protein with 4Fe4S-binding SPASM domain